MTIHLLEILKLDLPCIDFLIHCSKGTYVRKIAEDIGEELGCGAHITKIRRTQIGPFSLDQAHNPEKIDESYLIRDLPKL